MWYQIRTLVGDLLLEITAKTPKSEVYAEAQRLADQTGMTTNVFCGSRSIFTAQPFKLREMIIDFDKTDS